MTRLEEAPGPSPLPVVWSPSYEVDIGAHVFPTVKYRRVRERLLEEGVLEPDGTDEPEPATDEDLARVHTEEYLRKIREDDFSFLERQQLEVPFSPALRDAMILCCGGSRLTGVRALGTGVAVHLGGGFHHAFPGHGEGFCLLNDVAVAVRALQSEGAVNRVAVVDLDVHHGNGTAAVFADDPTVYTFSMHQENNYPLEKPPSDLDVGLADGTDDATYLELLEEHLERVLADSGAELVFYLAGADPYRQDQLGGLGLTLKGLARRDLLVLDRCRRGGVPAAVVLAGGYAFREADTVEIHAGTVRAAREVLRSSEG